MTLSASSSTQARQAVLFCSRICTSVLVWHSKLAEVKSRIGPSTRPGDQKFVASGQAGHRAEWQVSGRQAAARQVTKRRAPGPTTGKYHCWSTTCQSSSNLDYNLTLVRWATTQPRRPSLVILYLLQRNVVWNFQNISFLLKG